MRAFAFVLGLSVAALSGCSGDSKKKAEEPDSSWDMSDTEPAPQPKSTETDTGDDDDDEPAPKPSPKPKQVTQADDYEINHQDCDALGGAYGRAWENDEMKKLNARKLQQKQFDKAAAEIKQGSASMKQNWQDECYKTVGTAYLRNRLQCAMKAQSLERFNNCMDGMAD